MRQSTAATSFAALAFSLLAPANAQESNSVGPVVTPPPATSPVPDQSILVRDSMKLTEQCRHAQESWHFLPPEIEQRYRAIAENLRVQGLETPKVKVTYLPWQMLSLTAILNPADGQPGLTPDQAEVAYGEQITPLLSALGELRQEQQLSLTSVTFGSITENTPTRKRGGILVTFQSRAGVKNMNLPIEPEPETGLLSEAQRAATWGRAYEAALFQLKVPDSLDSNIQKEAVRDLEMLRDFYLLTDTPFLARVAQALLVRVDPDVDTIRTYANMGPIREEEMAQVPEPLRELVDSVRPFMRNIPPSSYFKVLEERTKDVEMTPLLEALLALENATGTYSREIIATAELELLEAIRYVKEEYGKLASPTPQQAVEIVRRYFSEHFPNDYKFGDQTYGVAGGIAVRRTDCSIRTLIGLELLRSVGIEAGVQVILPVENGQPIPGALAHIYNFIEVGENRVFVDFSRPDDQPFIFATNQEIIETYSGPNKIEVKVALDSKDLGAIAGFVRCEPIVDKIRMFTSAFGKHGGTLQQFMLDNPNMIPLVQVLVKYSRVQDKILATKEMAAWEAGTQEALRGIYPSLKQKVPEAPKEEAVP